MCEFKLLLGFPGCLFPLFPQSVIASLRNQITESNFNGKMTTEIHIYESITQLSHHLYE